PSMSPAATNTPPVKSVPNGLSPITGSFVAPSTISSPDGSPRPDPTAMSSSPSPLKSAPATRAAVNPGPNDCTPCCSAADASSTHTTPPASDPTRNVCGGGGAAASTVSGTGGAAEPAQFASPE